MSEEVVLISELPEAFTEDEAAVVIGHHEQIVRLHYKERQGYFLVGKHLAAIYDSLPPEKFDVYLTAMNISERSARRMRAVYKAFEKHSDIVHLLSRRTQAFVAESAISEEIISACAGMDISPGDITVTYLQKHVLPALLPPDEFIDEPEPEQADADFPDDEEDDDDDDGEEAFDEDPAGGEAIQGDLLDEDDEPIKPSTPRHVVPTESLPDPEDDRAAVSQQWKRLTENAMHRLQDMAKQLFEFRRTNRLPRGESEQSFDESIENALQTLVAWKDMTQ